MKVTLLLAFLLGSPVFLSAQAAQTETPTRGTSSVQGAPASAELLASLEQRLTQLESRIAAWEKSSGTSPARTDSGAVAVMAVDTPSAPSAGGTGETVALDVSAPSPATMAASRPARSAPNPYGVAARKLPSGQILLLYGGGELARFPSEVEANAFIRRWHEELAEKASTSVSEPSGT